ncbi:MAG: phosphatidylinositol-specific phospholipase C1-like protein [Edaphobacter sp.]
MTLYQAARTSIAIAVFAIGGLALAQQPTAAEQDQHVRVNQIQVIGSHNSYHAGFPPSARKLMEKMSPEGLHALDYYHAPLADQLSGGVRQIEIDVYADSKGGRYAHPAILGMVAKAGLPPDPEFDPEHVMGKPGFKVLHMQDIDVRSTCMTLIACLTDVRGWSKQHPQHLPIFILIETKEGKDRNLPNAVVPEPFTAPVFEALDKEIRSVFKSSEMITPDDVRGDSATLLEAVHAGRWPTLAQARGKVIFLLDQRHVEPIYTKGHPSLRGRVLFTNAEPGAPDAAFTEENDGSREEIDALVEQGYLVRTRSDESTDQARTNDTTRRDLALSSGAQMISTDYPPSEPSQWTKYVVEFPDGMVARCNPVTKPVGCVDKLLAPSVSVR